MIVQWLGRHPDSGRLVAGDPRHFDLVCVDFFFWGSEMTRPFSKRSQTINIISGCTNVHSFYSKNLYDRANKKGGLSSDSYMLEGDSNLLIRPYSISVIEGEDE